MEPLPQRQSMDDGLPQSPSACSLPVVFDLSRRRRENQLNPAPVDALHVARAPRWRGIDGGGAGLQESSSPCHAPLPSRRVRPDDAFSNTTVTLSYVNSSHILSSRGPLPPQLHAVPSLSGRLSRCSPAGESETGAAVREYRRAGGGQQMRAAGGKGVRSDRPEAYARAAPVQSVRGAEGGLGGKVACFPEETPEENGTASPGGPGGATRFGPPHADSRLSLDGAGDRGGAQNGMNRGLWDMESSKGKPSKLRTAGGSGVEQRQSGSDFLTSRPRGGAAQQGSRASGSICSPLNEDRISAFQEPLSPTASSPDEMEDVLTLPQASNSPSAHSSVMEGAVDDAPGEKLLGGERAEFEAVFVEDSCSDDSDVIEVPVTSSLTVLPGGVPEPFRKSAEPQDHQSEQRGRTHPSTKKEWNVPGQSLNGNAVEEDRTAERNKPPVRSRQGGMRLEAVVRNITPYRSKTSGHAQPSGPKAQTDKTHCVVSDGGAGNPGACQEDGNQTEVEEASVRVTLLPEDDGESTSPRESCSGAATSPGLPASTAVTTTGVEETEKQVEDDSPSHGGLQKKVPARAKTRRRSRAKQANASEGSRAAKSSSCSRKRKKRNRGGQSSMFSPQEPEIKLKYATYREEKKDVRADTFAPFVRLDRRDFATCTVVNYPEEENGRLKKGPQRRPDPALATGAVPTTSCLQLGRLDAEGRRQKEQVCCLCGQSANVMDLGDLHGPYRPHGVRAGPGTPADPRAPKDEDACSDSDSSYDGRGWKRGHSQAGSGKPGGPKRVAESAGHRGWVTDSDGLWSPPAKKQCTDSDPADQCSAPMPSPDTTEYWVHEDCGVWSAGVFLVRGKLYGLEEAIRLTRETVCSTCHRPGATLGCFFKGCPSKYHYSCAVQSDCVLNEDNFTMKCTKHKNKSFKGVTRLESR